MMGDVRLVAKILLGSDPCGRPVSGSALGRALEAGNQPLDDISITKWPQAAKEPLALARNRRSPDDREDRQTRGKDVAAMAESAS